MNIIIKVEKYGFVGHFKMSALHFVISLKTSCVSLDVAKILIILSIALILTNSSYCRFEREVHQPWRVTLAGLRASQWTF